MSLGLNPKIDLEPALSWAPSNIALVKYWGKRDEALHLPTHGSLSLSLGRYGTRTSLKWDTEASQDCLIMNQQLLLPKDSEFQRLKAFLDLFRPIEKGAYHLVTENNIPTAAGLASSASGFAALVKALNQLHQLNLDVQTLSRFARLGSGSACRSLEEGFVVWHAGQDAEGLDSYGQRLDIDWPELRWLVFMPSKEKKAVSSREAMKQTAKTCPWFAHWIECSRHWLIEAKQAVLEKDFTALGQIMEASCLMMHASMICSQPSLLYWKPQTLEMIRRIEEARSEGIACYFTIDAGPSVKVLYLEKDRAALEAKIQDMGPLLWVNPWEKGT